MHYCANNVNEFANGIFLNFTNLFKKIMVYHGKNKTHFMLFHSDYTIDMNFFHISREYSHVEIVVYAANDVQGTRPLFTQSTSHPAILYYIVLLLGKYGYSRQVEHRIRTFQTNYIFSSYHIPKLQKETFNMTEFPTLSKVIKFFNTHEQKQK